MGLGTRAPVALSAEPRPQWAVLGTRPGDRMIAAYFREETSRLRDACLADVESLEAWKAKRPVYRRQLLEMLGLDPMPERTDLKATITGRTDREGFSVEKLHFQSRAGLYVTGNLYLPKDLDGPAPAILYVCGHGGVKKGGVSYGNKVHYHHHGCWFARHGYVCLTIDSLQLGEIEGIHHGTYRYDMWWWNNRGYTSAGVEAWNCVRAIDYLESRKEVDPERIGVTGRSGGGVYSWWIAAIDERIRAAVPVAGITDLENHVVDGCVEGHCDCMFMVNTYRWDYPMVAALVAPRPLLIGNSDADAIFPENGVRRLYEKVRTIYGLFGAADKVDLLMTAGGHSDTPELRKPAFRWFDEHLMGVERPVERPVDDPAEKLLEPEDLKVFKNLPQDQRNSEIHETFTRAAPDPPVPASEEQWRKLRDGWREALQKKCFGGWPEKPEPLDVEQAFSVERHDVRLEAYDFTSQGPVRLRLYLLRAAGLEKPRSVTLAVADQQSWDDMVATMRPGFEKEITRDLPDELVKSLPEGAEDRFHRAVKAALQRREVLAAFAPRGIGPTAWNPDKRKQTQIRRRFMLLGQTLDGMRVWDARRAVRALRSVEGVSDLPLRLVARGHTAAVAMYASLFEPDVASLALGELPPTHREGPVFLNVRRYLDLPQAVAMAAERSEVTLRQDDTDRWQYPMDVVRALKWGENRLVIKRAK
jgi:dienelactone hydrolase